MPRLFTAVDFKNSEAYLTFNPRGPIHAVTSDYLDTEVVVVEWETEKGDLAHPSERTPILNKTYAHRIAQYERQRALQGLGAPTSTFGDDARPTKALLVGLRLVRLHRGPVEALSYTALAFDAYANITVDVTSPAVVEGLMARACGGQVVGSVAKELEKSQGLVRATDVAEVASTIRVPAFFVGGIASYDFLGINMARFQLQAQGAKPARSGVVPDVTLLWSDFHRIVSANAPGMPNGPTSSELIKAYKLNSQSNAPRPTAAVLDLYLDIKSPHAFLAVEMARQLEADFDVELRCIPFDIELSKIYGEERAPAKPKAGSKVPPPTSFDASKEKQLQDMTGKRSDAQKIYVRWTYSDLRRMASMRNHIIFGQEKVWNSRIPLMAMLFTLERGGRAAQDFFIDETYERTWKRQLNLEDPQVIAEIVARSMPDVHGAADRFLEYIAPGGRGQQALEVVLRVADKRGVWGVPAFYLDGELFWGKEQIAVLRKRLADKGRALRPDVVVDVPYLWRPPQDVKPSL